MEPVLQNVALILFHTMSKPPLYVCFYPDGQKIGPKPVSIYLLLVHLVLVSSLESVLCQTDILRFAHTSVFPTCQSNKPNKPYYSLSRKKSPQRCLCTAPSKPPRTCLMCPPHVDIPPTDQVFVAYESSGCTSSPYRALLAGIPYCSTSQIFTGTPLKSI